MLRRSRLDLALRIGGLLLLGLAWAAIIRLLAGASAPPRHEASFGECLLALTGFVSASTGSASLVLGAYLFDRVAVSEHWRPHKAPAPNWVVRRWGA